MKAPVARYLAEHIGMLQSSSRTPHRSQTPPSNLYLNEFPLFSSWTRHWPSSDGGGILCVCLLLVVASSEGGLGCPTREHSRLWTAAVFLHRPSSRDGLIVPDQTRLLLEGDLPRRRDWPATMASCAPHVLRLSLMDRSLLRGNPASTSSLECYGWRHTHHCLGHFTADQDSPACGFR
jgi:hypothetical protein